MERTLCTNGKRDDYFEDQVATSANFTKKTGFWIKETVEQLQGPDTSNPFVEQLPKEKKPKSTAQQAIIDAKPVAPLKETDPLVIVVSKEPADALNTPLINPAKDLSTTDFKNPIIDTNFESL